jgi:hypothetical protein
VASFKKGSIDFKNRSSLVQQDVDPDHINLYAKDGRLYNIDDQGVTSLISISGDIDLTPYTLTTTVDSISGDLQAKITNNDNDISTLQSQVTSISANFDNYATTSYVNNISGDLQSKIDNIVQETTTITGDSTLTIGQTGVNFSLSVADYISATEVYGISGDLQAKITNNDNDISTLQSQVTSISSNFDNYATNAYVLAISGNLQSQINATDSMVASLVPYNGATSDVNLGNNSLTLDSIYLNNSSVIASPRQISWNENEKTFNIGLTDEVTLQVGQEDLIRVYNNTGTVINNGQPVYITGFFGNFPTVALATADHNISETATTCLGLATETIQDSSSGYVNQRGIVRNLNTSSYSSGDILYLGEAIGTFTNSISGFALSSHINIIGHVGAVDAISGSVYVDISNEQEQLSLSATERNILIGNSSSTGVYEFTGITQASSTSFTVSPTKGWIVENTGVNAINPNVINVVYGGGTHSVTNISTQPATYVLIDRNSNIVQQENFPTPQERRDNIFLGKVVHNNLSTINTINNTVDYDTSPFSALRDMFSPINLLNSGVTISPNGSNLSFNRNAGTLYGLGINFTNNQKNPNSINLLGQTPVTIRSIVTRSTLIASNQTVIDPSQYDNTGVLTAVGGGSKSCTNQRVYQFPNGNIVVQYGQAVYDNIALAIAGIGTEPFVPYPTTVSSAVLIAYITVNKTATDLSNTTHAVITPAGLFGQPTAGVSSMSTGTLQQAYDNSIQPEIVINSTLDGVTIKNGTGNADNVTHLIEGQDANGLVTSYIVADGNSSFTGTTITSLSGSSGYIVTHDENGKLLDSGILATSLASVSTVASISAGLNSRLEILEDIDHNSFATNSYVLSISGDLQSQINDIHLSPYTLNTTTSSISGFLDEQQMLSLIGNCPINSFVLGISGINIEYGDHRGITNHIKTVNNNIDGFPVLVVEEWTYSNFDYTQTKSITYDISGGLSGSTINLVRT